MSASGGGAPPCATERTGGGSSSTQRTFATRSAAGFAHSATVFHFDSVGAPVCAVDDSDGVAKQVWRDQAERAQAWRMAGWGGSFDIYNIKQTTLLTQPAHDQVDLVGPMMTQRVDDENNVWLESSDDEPQGNDGSLGPSAAPFRESSCGAPFPRTITKPSSPRHVANEQTGQGGAV